MSNISNEVLKVIKGAIQLEINGRSFFEHAAEITQKELGKKVFRKLANDEIEHLRVFSQLFTELIGDEEWKKYVSERENAKSTLIEELKERMEAKGKEERVSELEALTIGMELERKAIDFFADSARNTSDPKAREIFMTISEEEKGHYDLLQAQHDSLSNSGYWFDMAEFKMDGKF